MRPVFLGVDMMLYFIAPYLTCKGMVVNSPNFHTQAAARMWTGFLSQLADARVSFSAVVFRGSRGPGTALMGATCRN